MYACSSCGCALPDAAVYCGKCGAPVATRLAAEVLSPDLVGASFLNGRYVLKASLGKGGMGAVYRAQDTRLRRDVALKVLNPELVAHPTARQRMAQEALALARIEHPNVVRVIDSFDEGAMLVIVMELVTGGDLASLLAKGQLESALAVDLVSRILDGLEAIHRAGLVHRDVKPANVLLSDDGQPKIADLGVARDNLANGRTRLGAVLGTPEYMSPEQVQGTPVDARSDLYAIGVMLYEMLAGRLPFVGHSDFDVASAHVRDAPDLRRLTGRCNAQAAAVVAKALEKLPADRFASAKEMAAALRAANRSEMHSKAYVPPSVQGSSSPPSRTPGVARTVLHEEVPAAAPRSSPSSRTPAIARTVLHEEVRAAAPDSSSPALSKSTVAPPRSGTRPVAVRPQRRGWPWILGAAALLGLGVAWLALRKDPAGSPSGASRTSPNADSSSRRSDEGSPTAAGRSGSDEDRPEPRPATADSSEALLAVTDYYECLSRGDHFGAFQRWGLPVAANFSDWKRKFGDNCTCAHVNSATIASQFGDSGSVDADLCVGDAKSGAVDRWRGSIEISRVGSNWKMTRWHLRKSGACSSACSAE